VDAVGRRRVDAKKIRFQQDALSKKMSLTREKSNAKFREGGAEVRKGN